MERLRVGVTEKNRNPYWDMVNAGWHDAAERLGLDVEIAAPESEDVEAQLALMRAQLDSGVDALAFVGTRRDAFDEIVADARGRGVAVVAFDLDAPTSGRQLFIGMEAPLEAGRRAGRQMAALVAAGSSVIVQTGSVKAPGAVGKRAGFLEVMAEHGIAVIEPASGSDGEDVARAQGDAEELLHAHPEVAGLFGVYGYHPIAQARALEAAGRSGGLPIVGFDLLPETVDLLADGKVAMSTWIQEYYFGYYAAAAVSDIVRLGASAALAIRGLDERDLTGNVVVPPPVTYTPQSIEEFRRWSAERHLDRRIAATPR